MKIGLLTQEYHTGENGIGGVGQAFGKIANWLAENDHNVTVYVQGRPVGVTEERPGLRVVRVGPKPRIHWRLRSMIARLPPLLRGWCWHFEINSAISDTIMEDYRNGVIEVLLANRGVTAPSLMIRRCLPAVVRVQHSMPIALRVEKVRVAALDYLLHFFEWLAIRRATVVYAPSRVVADYKGKSVGRDIQVIPTPMFTMHESNKWENIKAKHKLPDRFLLFWGGLLYCKGVETLTRALSTFLAEDHDHAFVFIGSQKYQNKQHDLIRNNIEKLAGKFPGRIMLISSLEHPVLLTIIHHCRVAVLPSAFDNLPNTVLEAMHFGCIIVATSGASIDEIIEDGKEGILVPIGDSTALAQAMLRASRMDGDTREVMSTAAIAKIRRVCNPVVVMPRLVEICKEAIQLHQVRIKA